MSARPLCLMISGAIYKLLNVADVTSLVNAISISVGRQGVALPQIVINENSSPENFKNDYNVLNHRVQIDIYCSKGKDGNGGYLQAYEIAKVVEEKLNRFTGLVVLSDTLANDIDTITLDSKENLYDSQQEDARVMMVFQVREKMSVAAADPSSYDVDYTIRVNGVVDSTGTINAYENNTFNISA